MVKLLMACALMAMWVRSLSVFDRWSPVRNTDSFVAIESRLSRIEWTRIRNPFSTDGPLYWSGPAFPIDVLQNSQIISRTQFLGFEFSIATFPPFRTEYDRWIIPYWSIVIPLALLSAYLLLVPLGGTG